jgi:uncharacterized protein involved in exopolysaccharide biosynthesis
MRTSAVSANTLARLLWSRRGLLSVFVLVAAILSAIYSLTRELQFESDALLAQSKDETSQLGSSISGLIGQVAGLAGGLLQGQGTSVEESVAVLNSRDFALRFMREHGVLQYLFPDQWDRKTQTWKAHTAGLSAMLPGNAATARAPGPSADDAVKAFDGIRLVTIDRRTDFVRLSVRGPSPEVAQTWATALIRELNEVLRNRALDDTRRAVELLSKRVDTEQLQSVRTIVSALLELQLRREVMAESRREYALRMLDPPSLPDQRFYPHRTRMVLTGMLIGFVLGAIFVIAQQLRRRWRGAAGERRV